MARCLTPSISGGSVSSGALRPKPNHGHVLVYAHEHPGPIHFTQQPRVSSWTNRISLIWLPKSAHFHHRSYVPLNHWLAPCFALFSLAQVSNVGYQAFSSIIATLSTPWTSGPPRSPTSCASALWARILSSSYAGGDTRGWRHSRSDWFS